MNVLLVCQAGMSTAILCKKISEVAEKAGQSLHIEACLLYTSPSPRDTR